LRGHTARNDDAYFILAQHRLSSSSVVRASGEIAEGRGFKSHLELGFVSELRSLLHLILLVTIAAVTGHPHALLHLILEPEEVAYFYLRSVSRGIMRVEEGQTYGQWTEESARRIL